MPRQADPQRSDDTVAAIERVLRAEREGVEALRQSQDRAQHMLAEARAQAAASPAAPTAAFPVCTPPTCRRSSARSKR